MSNFLYNNNVSCAPIYSYKGRKLATDLYDPPHLTYVAALPCKRTTLTSLVVPPVCGTEY